MPIRIGPAGGGSGGGGNASFGALIRDASDPSHGLFISWRDADPSWHLRGVEREIAEGGTPSTAVYAGSNSADKLTLTWPLDFKYEGVSILPESINTASLRHSQYPKPVAEVKAFADYYGVRVSSRRDGTDGNGETLTFNYGRDDTKAVQSYARIPFKRGFTADDGEFLQITSPGGGTAASGSSQFQSNRRINYAFHQEGESGNGVRILYRLSKAASGGGTVTAEYDSETQLTITISFPSGSTGLAYSVNISDIVTAVNAARWSNARLVFASLGSADGLVGFVASRNPSVGDSLTPTNPSAARGGVTLSGGIGYTGLSSNIGEVRVSKTGARVAGAKATGSVDVDPSGATNNIVLTAKEESAALNGFRNSISYNGVISANSVSASGSEATQVTIRVNGTVTIQAIVDAINNNSSQRFTAALASGVNGSTQVTWSSGDSLVRATIAGGVNPVNPLEAIWDDDNHRLVIRAIDTDTLNDVRAKILELDEFTSSQFTLIRALTTDTIELPSAIGQFADYAFGGGRDATHRSAITFSESSSALVVNGVVAGDTVKDVLDRAAIASLEFFTLGVRPNFQQTSAFPVFSDSTVNFANGVDAVARQLPQVSASRSGRVMTYTIEFHGSTAPAGQRTTLSEMKAAWDAFDVPDNSDRPTAVTAGSSSSRIATFPTVPTGGDNPVPAGDIEALVRPEDEVNGPNVEVRYHNGFDTLKDVLDALLEQGIVTVVEIYGTDLTAHPESPPFARAMYPQGGTIINQGGSTFLLTDDKVLDLAKQTRGAGDRGKFLGTSKTNENDMVLLDAPEGGGAAITVEDEGTALATAAEILNFAGAGVTVTNDSDAKKKVITIPGGGGPAGVGSADLVLQQIGANVTTSAAVNTATDVSAIADYPDVFMLEIDHTDSAGSNQNQRSETYIIRKAEIQEAHGVNKNLGGIANAAVKISVANSKLQYTRLAAVFPNDATLSFWRMLSPPGDSVYIQYSTRSSPPFGWVNAPAANASYQRVRFASGKTRPADGSSDWTDPIGLQGPPGPSANVPSKASNTDVDAETDDADYMTVLKTFRAIARKVKNASTTVRGIVLVARNADVDSTETDTTRVLDVAKAKRLIARLIPTNRQIPAGGTDNQVLKKKSNTDYDTEWADDATGSGNGGAALSDATPQKDGTGAAGSGTKASRDDHVHPKELGDDVITPAMLDSDSASKQTAMRNRIGALGTYAVKAWAAGTWRVGELSRHTGNVVYMCTTARNSAHTSGPDADTSNWVALNAFRGAWTQGWYAAGQYVLDQSAFWVANQNVANDTQRPSANSKWTKVTNEVPTDAVIGDKAFSNPPGDLTNTEKKAVRDAIGAGTGSGSGGGLSDVSTDSTITGDGTSGDPLKVANPFTDADETKLDGIAAGAEVNVQSDINVTDDTSDAFIKNRATIARLNAQGTLFANQFPSYIATDAEITAAINALKGGAPSDMDTLKELADAIGLRWEDKGDFGSTSTYVKLDVVTHNAPADAFYIATKDVPAGKTPGVASDWKDFWDRISWTEGAPSSLTGTPTYEDGVLAVTDRGGNKHEVTLGGEVQSTFAPVILFDGNLTMRSQQQWVAVDFTHDSEWDDYDAIHVSGQLREDALLQATIYKEDLEDLANGVPITGTWYAGATKSAVFLVDQGGPGMAVGRTADKGQLLFAHSQNSLPQTNPSALRIMGIKYGGIKGDKGDAGESQLTFVASDTKRMRLDQFNWIAYDIDKGDIADDTEIVLKFSAPLMSAESAELFGSDIVASGVTSGSAASLTNIPVAIKGKRATGSDAGIYFIYAGWNSSNKLNIALSFSRSSVEAFDMKVSLYKRGSVTGGTTPTPTISSFTATSGSLTPVAGSIGTVVYGVEWAIAQSSHLGAARIVGFKGTAAIPNSVAVLDTLTADEYAHGSGDVVIPGGVSLAADEVYTLRLEIYRENDNVATDLPVSYQDIRIVAHAPATADYHEGYLLYRAADDTVAKQIARITDFSGDTDTSNTRPTRLTIDVPEDTNEYQPYLIVKATATQPTGFTSVGLPATTSFYDAQDLTINSVAFKVYLIRQEWRVTHEDNSDYFGITYT